LDFSPANVDESSRWELFISTIEGFMFVGC
jgi:hypothetical protein